MLTQPGISEIHQFTQACQLDLCEVGNIMDPSTGTFMKKEMTVLTTSPSMYRALHGHMCRGNHEHQPIEGSIRVDNQSIRRTTYTEVYPRKFARLVAKILSSNSHEWPFRWNHGMMTSCEVPEPLLVARSSPLAVRPKHDTRSQSLN